MSFPICLVAWMSPKHSSHGLPVWVPLARDPQRSLIYTRLDDALGLLKANAPARYERVTHSLKGFLVIGIDRIDASYDPRTKVCQLRERFMMAPDTTVARIACAIVHEATHGWLYRLGIKYDEPIRHRVEQVCINAALLTARRLSGADAEVEHCRGQLSISPSYFSTASFDERLVDELRVNGMPEWLIRIGLWVRRRKRRARVVVKE